MVITNIHAEKETHARELIEKGLKLEADLRAAEPLREEVIHLRLQIKKLTSTKQELTNQVQSLTQELTRVRADNQQILTMKAEIDKLHQELMRVWTGIEYEKKGNYKLMEQKQSMEKKLISMTCEIEKSRADLATMDGRPWVVAEGCFILSKALYITGFLTGQIFFMCF
ncbi:protein FLX-like 3 isoform X1 [Zingiber officinale]|uniref:protein FLX-like 3 isoform X1 n=1 Tax=Zingiber officinale TaxID=94328 RepID=UPI001C4CB85F|nr:protein FLX-like 3 isoform X1 [Zingiber officinale]